ncbi:MAG: SCO family protein [Ignavibacteriaceae bacterium]|jgi:protein SCO1/2
MYKSHPEYPSKYILIVFITVLFFSFWAGCGRNLPVEKSIRTSFQLINQDSNKVVFPNHFKGNITVMSFMYTNCPDVCPMTTNNLRLLQEQLKKDNVKGVQFAEVSFDPDRDTPSILKKYADVRNIDEKNFQLLTGNKDVIDSLLKVMNIYAIPADTINYDNGGFTYSFIHTDRITLLDRESRIRKEYKGSIVDQKEILEDIKSLE